MANEIGDLLAKFVIGINDSIDTRMGVETFKDKESEFTELSHIAGDIIEDKVVMTNERLLMIKVAALYASTFVQAKKDQPPTLTIQESSSDDSEE